MPSKGTGAAGRAESSSTDAALADEATMDAKGNGGGDRPIAGTPNRHQAANRPTDSPVEPQFFHRKPLPARR